MRIRLYRLVPSCNHHLPVLRTPDSLILASRVGEVQEAAHGIAGVPGNTQKLKAFEELPASHRSMTHHLCGLSKSWFHRSGDTDNLRAALHR
ncbi:MAG: hypothetical protein ACPGLY_16310 [Rubripirellula sp.]